MIKSWPATALTVCLHHAGVTGNDYERNVDEPWAKKHLNDLVIAQLLTQAEADEIRLRCGWGVQMRMEL